MDIKIAVRDDIETLLKFRLAYLREAFAGADYDEAEITAALRDYFNRNIGGAFTAYIAQIDGESVSVIFLVRVEKPANLNFLNGKTAMLMNVCTLKRYRRRGIADALLKRVISDAKAEAISCIDLTATEMGKALYEKNGFRELDGNSSEMRLKL
jgi:GNAT superfamily N-acetyltransferase